MSTPFFETCSLGEYVSSYGSNYIEDKQDKENEKKFISEVSHEMINSFMAELSVRIREMVRLFPKNFLDKFVTSTLWTKNKRTHDVVYFDLAVQHNNPNVWRINKYLGEGLVRICKSSL